MTTFTDEDKELIKEIRERIGSLDVRDNIERRAYEIALASLEAEPVAECIVEDGGMCIDGFGEYVGHSLPDGTHQLYTAPPAQVVPDEMYWQDAPVEGSSKAAAYATGWNSCRAAMLQSQREGNPHVTPARLPGGFTIEDAKELHEGLVRSHISQALSGEKMKKKDRDADLRWIHGVIVQAAWFVKASLEQNALTGNSQVTPDGWVMVPKQVTPEISNAINVVGQRCTCGNCSQRLWDLLLDATQQGG
ncbi:DUF551 domain-containing protein [Escherichia coli]|uniref:DUF551 domain-containing protein n=1 Tax=Escherichia coli TaxID=562 RepID=UPI0013EFBF6E|nr:DUF551 domain-containing protein [Escherichia coli]HCP1378654.1 DUF551 domain-containing protein [Escherichia coli]